MLPIDQLLNRIRWDKHFGRGAFELGYLDRRSRTLQRVPLADLAFPPARRVFVLLDDTGRHRHIPYHRVREVYRNGHLIWHRPVQP